MTNANGNPAERDLSLCDALDRVLNTGAVLHGEAVLSVAGVDLVVLGLNVLVASVDALDRGHGEGRRGTVG